MCRSSSSISFSLNFGCSNRFITIENEMKHANGSFRFKSEFLFVKRPLYFQTVIEVLFTNNAHTFKTYGKSSIIACTFLLAPRCTFEKYFLPP